MLIACWSSKGGAGTTVVAVGFATVLARAGSAGALLVDLAGDAPGALGLPEPDVPGAAAWLAADGAVPTARAGDAAAGLAANEVVVGRGLSLIPRGPGPIEASSWVDALAALLAADPRDVVVDVGLVTGGAAALLPLVAQATRSLLVTRACYLALRRAMAVPVRPSGIVLIAEAGRSLTAADVASVLGAPVVAEIPIDPAVARVVDAGLLPVRMPRTLERPLVALA